MQVPSSLVPNSQLMEAIPWSDDEWNSGQKGHGSSLAFWVLLYQRDFKFFMQMSNSSTVHGFLY